MPVNHMVWIRFRPDVPAERIAAHLEGLRSLATRVPVVRGLTVGPNFTDRANGCTHGLSVILDDRAGLAAYAVHPHHVEVATALRRDAAEVLALDYEY
jgi:Stress responsive A/B Barrel Domain